MDERAAIVRFALRLLLCCSMKLALQTLLVYRTETVSVCITAQLRYVGDAQGLRGRTNHNKCTGITDERACTRGEAGRC